MKFVDQLIMEPASSELTIRGTGFLELEIPPGRSKTGNRRFRQGLGLSGFQYGGRGANRIFGRQNAIIKVLNRPVKNRT